MKQKTLQTKPEQGITILHPARILNLNLFTEELNIND